MKKIITWLAVLVGIFGVGYWIYRAVTKPLPGEAVTDAGREHVTDIAGVKYNSDPPTSGSHFPVWAKPGVYDRLISDGYFIHSMEHGYVVIWYDCSKPVPSAYRLVPLALAHDEPAKDSTDSGQLLKHMKISPTGTMSWFTPQNPPDIEVELPDSFKTDSCKALVSQLSEFTKVAQRIILTPRLNMDAPIAVTAWDRILKLQKVDKEEINAFIKAFHNRGPEQTTE